MIQKLSRAVPNIGAPPVVTVGADRKIRRYRIDGSSIKQEHLASVIADLKNQQLFQTKQAELQSQLELAQANSQSQNPQPHAQPPQITPLQPDNIYNLQVEEEIYNVWHQHCLPQVVESPGHHCWDMARNIRELNESNPDYNKLDEETVTQTNGGLEEGLCDAEYEKMIYQKSKYLNGIDTPHDGPIYCSMADICEIAITMTQSLHGHGAHGMHQNNNQSSSRRHNLT